MNDHPADREKNRLSARAARYARVGANVGGEAARMAGARPLGSDRGRGSSCPLPRWRRASLQAAIPRHAVRSSACPSQLRKRVARFHAVVCPRMHHFCLLSDAPTRKSGATRRIDAKVSRNVLVEPVAGAYTQIGFRSCEQAGLARVEASGAGGRERSASPPAGKGVKEPNNCNTSVRI